MVVYCERHIHCNSNNLEYFFENKFKKPFRIVCQHRNDGNGHRDGILAHDDDDQNQSGDD